MLFNCLETCQSGGIFKREYRRQLFSAISVTTITLCHGIGLGWLSPMLVKLQSPTDTPLSFSVSVEEASWIGAVIGLGGLIGNFLSVYLLEGVGRKIAIYFLALPYACLWILLYFAESFEFLVVARFCAGLTGGGVFIVLPIFIGEIADPIIRGRLSSIFSLALNIGVLIGSVLSSYVRYHLIPYIAMVVLALYLLVVTFLPETPQYLLRKGRDAAAERSLKYYRNYKGASKAEQQRFQQHFAELKAAVCQQESQNDDVKLGDFLTKPSLRAMCTGVVLMGLNMFSGTFALVNYMANIFAATKTELHPDTNTIIISAVQILGTYIAIILVDRFGRKVLMITSTAGMGIGLAAFGLYAFYAEEDEVDLSPFSWWLPLLLMAMIILLANIGIIPVAFVILVEIMPVKIRSKAVSFCLAVLSAFGFIMLKIFPVIIETFGLSATMWFCATVCTFGLFYISIFLTETKGKSMDRDDA